MNKISIRILIAAAAALAVVSIANAAPPTKTATTSKGPTLTDSRGMSLYTFDKDSDGKSACNGPCATNWPPLSVADNAKDMGAYTIIVRDDGKKQWTYKGWPLYYWSKDTKAGDKTGDGFNGVWKVARP